MTTKAYTRISIAAVSMAFACATPLITYSGPRLSGTEAAILRIGGTGRILRIDDRGFNGRTFELEPGDHSVYFKFIVRDEEIHPGAYDQQETVFCEAVFRAEPGRHYEIVRTDTGEAASTSTLGAKRGSHEFQVRLLDLGSQQDVERSVVICE